MNNSFDLFDKMIKDLGESMKAQSTMNSVFYNRLEKIEEKIKYWDNVFNSARTDVDRLKSDVHTILFGMRNQRYIAKEDLEEILKAIADVCLKLEGIKEGEGLKVMAETKNVLCDQKTQDGGK